MRKMLVRVAIGAVALSTVAGCGQTLTIGGQPASTTPASNADIQLVGGPAPATSSTPAPPVASIPLGSLSAPQTVQLTAKSSPLGTIVTDKDGRTLYRFDKDSPKPPTTTCTGGCQTTWPPVIIQQGGKVYADGVDKSVVGTVKRPDGSTQLTIGGWPLYRFSGDHAAGATLGQGVNGTWFAIAPDGKKASTATKDDQNANAGPKTILTAQKSAQGLVVSDGGGHTIYVNSTDQSSPSAVKCTGACSNGFTPVPAGTGNIQIKGVAPSDVGSVKRPDGSTQMTLVGFPLYTNPKDTKAGDTAGSGVQGWFTISLDGDHQG
ncbi:Secreted repeat-containing protein [Kutzneria sp. CA-103260]|nr:Secreted repeat-containing protein [Kutzneria sp. CA-103260]